MLTVHEVAERYGVTDEFMVRALDLTGFKNAKSDTALPAPTIARFEARFGDKIRAARPQSQPGSGAESEVGVPDTPASRQHDDHVMRVAHERVTVKRLPGGHKVKALLDDPGPVHAIDAAGTWDGDPWRGRTAALGGVHFFGGGVKSGPTAACGKVRVRAVLRDEFVPADDPDHAGQCRACAAVVADGRGFRESPHDRDIRRTCASYLRQRIDGDVVVEDCSLRDRHRGPHRTLYGVEWSDYRPTAADRGRPGVETP